MRLLTLNTGSSSLKFDIWSAAAGTNGRTNEGSFSFVAGKPRLTLDGVEKAVHAAPQQISDAIHLVLAMLRDASLLPVDAIVHRVVHGGRHLDRSVLIDEAVVAEIEAATELAPLHNRPALDVIRAAREAMPATPMVAVFDTTFHRQMPDKARLYAIDRSLAEKHGIQRYGFHGMAHQYMSERWAEITGKDLGGAKLITLQLGSGCSAAAIATGHSIDTSMGFTPLAGLIMQTRSGDIDPAIVAYLSDKEGVPAIEVEAWLNHSSGLQGIAGRHDMRELLSAEEAGDENAALAIEMFVYQVQKYVGAYLVALGGVDAIIFGGGIGENAPAIRARVMKAFDWMGFKLDEARNDEAQGVDALLSSADSAFQAWTIAVDEGSVLVREAVRIIGEGNQT